MKKLIPIFIFAIISLINFSCGNRQPSTENYEQNKMSLEDQEKSEPLKFLSTDGTFRGTLFGEKMVLNGTVTNSATIATFKDVTLNVHFYSKTQTEIGSSNYVIYDFFPPRQSKDFKFKIEVPGGTETIGWDIISATAQ